MFKVILVFNCADIESVSKSLKFGPKWQLLYFKLILSAIFVTIAPINWNEFYTTVILLINQLKEIGEKQLSVFGSRGGQISPLMHIPLLEYLP